MIELCVAGIDSNVVVAVSGKYSRIHYYFL